MSSVNRSHGSDRSVEEMVQGQKQANAAGAEYMKGCTETLGKAAGQAGQKQGQPQGAEQQGQQSAAAGQTAIPRPQ